MAKKRVLVIADTHVPFHHKNYLKFLKEQYDRFNCDTVVHIGDFADAYGFSFYDLDPDTISLNDELHEVGRIVQEWAKVFPKMILCSGNHEKRIARKLAGAGLPRKFWPTYEQIFQMPKGWKYVDSKTIDGVLYVHGEAGDAARACLVNQQSTVSGHLHTKFGVTWHQSPNGKKLFGMQVGTGIDINSYVFNYAKNHKPQQLGCGVVIEGSEAYAIPFDPKKYK